VGGTLHLRGEILRADGSEVLKDEAEAPIEDGAELGRDMAGRLLARAGPDFFQA
jgi:hydroxymethylbilane synthase